jgi:hypothetical protein
MNPANDPVSQLTSIVKSKNVEIDEYTAQELADYFAGAPGKSFGPL